MKTYRTVAALQQGFENAELHPRNNKICFDGETVYVPGKKERGVEEVPTVFEMPVGKFLEQATKLAGLPRVHEV